MDSKIKTIVRSCRVCQSLQNLPSSAPLYPWEWLNHPWTQLHADYTGPFLGKMFLVIIDAYSKWIDAYPLNKFMSNAIIKKI